MIEAFHIEVADETGSWREIHRTDSQYLRLFKLSGPFHAVAVKLTVDAVRGNAPKNKLFSFDVR